MRALDNNERIERLEQRLKRLKALQARVDARRRSLETRRTRQEDTRRKILVGAIVLAKVEQGVMDESLLRGWLDKALVRGDDRDLFSLRDGNAVEGAPNDPERPVSV